MMNFDGHFSTPTKSTSKLPPINKQTNNYIYISPNDGFELPSNIRRRKVKKNHGSRHKPSHNEYDSQNYMGNYMSPLHGSFDPYAGYNPYYYPQGPYPGLVSPPHYNYQGYSPASYNLPRLNKTDPKKETEKTNRLLQKNTDVLGRISQTISKLNEKPRKKERYREDEHDVYKEYLDHLERRAAQRWSVPRQSMQNYDYQNPQLNEAYVGGESRSYGGASKHLGLPNNHRDPFEMMGNMMAMWSNPNLIINFGSGINQWQRGPAMSQSPPKNNNKTQKDAKSPQKKKKKKPVDEEEEEEDDDEEPEEGDDDENGGNMLMKYQQKKILAKAAAKTAAKANNKDKPKGNAKGKEDVPKLELDKVPKLDLDKIPQDTTGEPVEIKKPPIDRVAMKRKLKCYLWLFATPKLIANKVISYSFQRRILLDQYYQKMIPVIEEILNAKVYDHVAEIMNYKKPIDVTLQPGKQPPKDLQTRLKYLTDKIDEIIKQVNAASLSNEYDPDTMRLFAMFVAPKTFIPDKYFSAFEINRLQFNAFGRIANQSEPAKLMIIMVQIFLRCLVHKVILRPKSKGPAKPLSTLNDTQKANLRLLASIIYYIVISVIKDVPIVPNNQSHLVEDEQFVAAPALQAIDLSIQELETQKASGLFSKEDIFHGLIPFDWLSPVFTDTKIWVNLMRTNVLAAARNVLKNIPSYWNNKLIFPDVQIDA